MSGNLTLTIDGKPVKVKWHSTKPPTEADVDEIARSWRTQNLPGGKVLPAFTGSKATARSKGPGFADFLRGAKESIGDTVETTQRVNQTVGPTLAKGRKKVADVVSRLAVPYETPEQLTGGISSRRMVAKGLESFDPTQLIGIAGDPTGEGAARGASAGGPMQPGKDEPTVNKVMRFLANPVAPTVMFALGIDEELATRATTDPRAMEELIGRLGAGVLGATSGKQMLSIAKGAKFGKGAAKVLTQAERTAQKAEMLASSQSARNPVDELGAFLRGDVKATTEAAQAHGKTAWDEIASFLRGGTKAPEVTVPNPATAVDELGPTGKESLQVQQGEPPPPNLSATATKEPSPSAGASQFGDIDANLITSGSKLHDDAIGHMVTPSGKGVQTKQSVRGGFDNHWEVAADAGYIPKEWVTQSPPVDTQSIVSGMLKEGWIRWKGERMFEAWEPNAHTLSILQKRLDQQRMPPNSHVYLDFAGKRESYHFTYADYEANGFDLQKTISRTNPEPYQSAPPLDFSKYRPDPTPGKLIQDAPVPKEGAPLEVKQGGSTGIANAVQDAEATAGALNESPRATGTKKGTAHAEGKRLVEEGELDPQTLARDIAEGKRTFKDETEVGALIEGKRRLLNRVESLRKEIDESIGKGEPNPHLVADYTAAQDELAEYVKNIQAGKGKWSDVGRALQEGTTLDEGSFSDVLAEYSRRKGVKPSELNPREVKALEEATATIRDLEGKLKAADDELARVKAEEGLQRASADSVRRRGTPGRRSVQQIQSDKAAARESLAKSFAKITRAPSNMGLGAGAFQDAFDAVPEIARDIRKLIELHIEEIGAKRLDAEFYTSAKSMVRGVFDDDEWEALGLAPAEFSDRDINKLLAGYYEQTSNTQSGAQNMVRELKKQAQLLDQIDGALEGDAIKYGSAPGKPSKAVETLRNKLNVLLKQIGEGPGKDAARTRLKGIIEGLEAQSKGKYRNLKDRPPVDPLDVKELKAKVRELRKDMRLEDTIADLDEQLRTGNLKGPSPRVATSTTAQKRLEMEINLQRRKVQAQLGAANRKTNIGVQALKETTRVARMLVLGSDFGVMLRQGLHGVVSPKAYGKAIANVKHGLRSDADLLALEEAMLRREHNGQMLEPIRRKAGLSRASVIGDREEGAVARMIDGLFGATLGRIPGLKGKVGFLGRGQEAFLNTVRTEMFDNFYKKHPDASPQELKEWADYLNSAFGRSSSYGAKRAPGELAQVILTSPRYEASRWEMVGNYLASPLTAVKAFKSPAARAKFVNMGATAATVLTTLKVAAAASDGELVLDPDSSDFLKLRVGNTAYDFTAGISPRLRGALRAMFYFADPESKTQYRKSDGSAYKRNETMPKEILSAVTRPVTPAISGAVEERTGYSLSGWRDDEGDPKGWERLMPLIMQGFKQDYQQEGWGTAARNAAVEFLGGSAQRYKPPPK